MYLVSSCLCGYNCRYDGVIRRIDANPIIEKIMAQGLAVPVCPEVLGGLTIPRLPAEIFGGTGRCVLKNKAKVINICKDDVTDSYLSGAYKSLLIGLQTGCKKAILKARSPACGIGTVYDGSFSRNLIAGDGVLSALLKSYGFTVINEEMLALSDYSLY